MTIFEDLLNSIGKDHQEQSGLKLELTVEKQGLIKIKNLKEILKFFEDKTSEWFFYQFSRKCGITFDKNYRFKTIIDQKNLEKKLIELYYKYQVCSSCKKNLVKTTDMQKICLSCGFIEKILQDSKN